MGMELSTVSNPGSASDGGYAGGNSSADDYVNANDQYGRPSQAARRKDMMPT